MKKPLGTIDRKALTLILGGPPAFFGVLALVYGAVAHGLGEPSRDYWLVGAGLLAWALMVYPVLSLLTDKNRETCFKFGG